MSSKDLLKIPFICVLLCFISASHASHEEHVSDEFESFFAIGLIGGITETNLINRNFERVDETTDFLDVNFELQLRWKGLFYENPGRSQENVDGLFSGDAIGYNFYNSEHWAFDIYLVNTFSEGEFTFRTSEETLILPRESNDRLGIRATGYFSDYLAQFIVTPISLENEIGGVNASLSIRRTWLLKNWNLYATVGLNYQSDDIVDYYWGLSDTESADIRRVLKNIDAPFNPYEAEGGVFSIGEVGFEYPVSEHFVFGGFMSVVGRPSAVVDSPLTFDGRTVATAALSLTYVF